MPRPLTGLLEIITTAYLGMNMVIQLAKFEVFFSSPIGSRWLQIRALATRRWWKTAKLQNPWIWLEECVAWSVSEGSYRPHYTPPV